MASFDIGAKLRQERVGQGLAIVDIARDTRIASRFLEAIEADDFAHLPGLVFTRNFVRQYALALKLDPDPLLAELPRLDEASVQLPNPPARPRSSYHLDRKWHSVLSSLVWLMIAGGAGGVAWIHYNHSLPAAAPATSATALQPAPANEPVNQSSTSAPQDEKAASARTAGEVAPTVQPPVAATAQNSAVQVSMTAHEPAWVQVTADGKTTFTGTMQSNETREISAGEVKILTGNAGALTISLNGKTLESLGPIGQVRSVRLTAEGPQLLSKAPQSAPPAPL